MRVTRRGRPFRVVHGGRPKVFTRPVGTWTTGTGERVPIAQMSSRHLVNTIFMMRRQWHSMMVIIYAPVQDPPSILKQRMMAEEVKGPGALWPVYDELMAEATKRKVL